jgi:spore maturation protein CgeB
MKILIIRPFTRTAFELGGYCAKAFVQLGHEVMTFNFRYGHQSFLGKIRVLSNQMRLMKVIGGFKPKFVLVIKGDKIPPEMIIDIRKKFKIPLANYWIDDPLWIKISSQLSPFYDYFFTNDPRCVEAHQKAGCPNVNFLTFGCDPDLHRTVNLSEDEKKKFGNEVCFTGTMVSQREKMLEALADFDLKIWWPFAIQYTDEDLKIKKRKIDSSSALFSRFTGRDVWGEEMVKVFNASKICLNIHSQGGDGTNMRTFEVVGAGGFLLCEFRKVLSDLFKIGEEIVCFKDASELKELIKYYLVHPEERKRIAHRGQERAYKEHTYKHRMEEIASLLRIL